MITHSISKVKQAAIENPLVNQVCFGPIEEYDHKATIKYPYVNIDIVKNIIMYKNPIKILEYNNFFNNNEEVIKDEYLNKAIDSVLLNKNDMKE